MFRNRLQFDELLHPSDSYEVTNRKISDVADRFTFNELQEMLRDYSEYLLHDMRVTDYATPHCYYECKTIYHAMLEHQERCYNDPDLYNMTEDDDYE
jgi:hypothetical protein